MRIDELLIDKYGVFDSRRLDLSSVPGLAVLYGRNEAGKSTTLSAVVDLLYGIPARTPLAQVFGGPAMALSASLHLANGTAIKVRRTKGNARTLTDGEGSALDEVVLASHLGANDRERFLALFALNHESLRSGGEQLLDARGDIGRLIVEAGGGLRSLASEMELLAARADALYGARKSDKRLFYIELERYQHADRLVKDGLLTVEAHERTLKDARAAKARLEDIRTQLLAVREYQKLLERMARVCPLLHQLARQQEVLAEYDDLPNMVADFAVNVRAVLIARQEAQLALLNAESAVANIIAQIDASNVPKEILDVEADISDIVVGGLHVSKERADRGGRVTELAKSQALLDGLRRLTGLTTETDIAPLMPPPGELDRVRAMAGEATRLNAEIRALEGQVKEAAGQAAQLQTQIEAAEAAGNHVPLGFDAIVFAALDAQHRDIVRRQDEIKRIAGEIERKLKTGGFESIEALVALRLPEEQTIQSQIDRASQQARSLQQQQDIVIQQTQLKNLRSTEITRLRTGEEVPTKDAIEAVRSQRALAWEPIKRVYLAESSTPNVETSIETRSACAKHLEEVTAAADRLSDRTSEEAQRIAAIKLALQDFDAAEAAVLAARQEIENLEHKSKSASEAWEAAWPDAVKLTHEPTVLKVLAAERDAALTLDHQLSEASAEVNRLDALFQSGVEALAAAEEGFGICADETVRITTRIQAVTQRSRQHEADFADYRAARKSFLDAEARHSRAVSTLQQLRGELSAWLTNWSPLMARLKLHAGATPEMATDAAAKWSEALGVLTTIAVTEQRLANMDRDENRLREKVDAIKPRLSFGLPTDVVAAAEMLRERLEEAKSLQNVRNGLESQAQALAPAREKAQCEVADSISKISSLCAGATCEEKDLSVLASRFEERTVCREQIRQTEQNLLSSGDQLPIELLREQLAGRELDQISAALYQYRERESSLQTELEFSVKEEELLKQELQRFNGTEDINQPVVARESAAAGLRQVVSDYLELALARELIEEAMTAVREDQQDPLLARAGALFSQTTRGAFHGIRADVDERGSPSVVGIRGSGEHVAINIMSDGTRDQLFLAFRVAAVEQYCAHAEPLPFIADDLLVHFDDGRSLAALELLAELGKTTQVLLFTHHAQVRDSAAELVKRGLAGVVELR